MKNSRVENRLLSRQYFRLLPFQVLMLLINAANCIVDRIYASNFIGKTAMTSLGFYAPMDHFLFAVSMMLVSGSQLLVGKALAHNDLNEVRRFFTSDLTISCVISVITALLMALISATGC